MDKRKTNKGKGGTSKDKIGLLGEDIFNYYRRVFDTVNDGFENKDEQEIFLNNVFDQLKEEAVKVSQNQSASRFIETLLSYAGPKHLYQILRAFSNDWSTVATDRCASHVFQTLISLLPTCFCQENVKLTSEGEDTVEDLFINLCTFLKEHLETIFVHTYGNHILRVVLEVLAGVSVSEDLVKRKVPKNKQKNFEESMQKTIVIGNRPEQFQTALSELVKTIFKICNYEDHLTDKFSNPVIQTVLLILKKTNPELCNKYCKRILNKICHQSSEQSEDSEVGSLPDIVQNPVGAFLVEQIVCIASGSLFNKVFESLFKGRILYFAVHNFANYVLQRLIAAVKEKDLFEEIFDEISLYVEDVLALNHVGIITKLAEACVRLETKQNRFIKLMMKAFHCYEPAERQTKIVPVLAAFTTYEVFFKMQDETDKKKDEEVKEDEKMSSLLSTINFHGSLLLQQLVKFENPKLLVTSFLQLKPVELQIMSCDLHGGHIVCAFFLSSTIGEKSKEEVTQKLKGLYIDVACNKYGSYSLDAMWKSLHIKQKAFLAEELSKNEDRLRSDQYGCYIHRNFAISHFIHRKHDWTDLQGAKSKKRKLFKDIFEDSKDKIPKKHKNVNSEQDKGSVLGKKSAIQLEDSESDSDKADEKAELPIDEIFAVVSKQKPIKDTKSPVGKKKKKKKFNKKHSNQQSGVPVDKRTSKLKSFKGSKKSEIKKKKIPAEK